MSLLNFFFKIERFERLKTIGKNECQSKRDQCRFDPWVWVVTQWQSVGLGCVQALVRS